jgi:hypothetical protein
MSTVEKLLIKGIRSFDPDNKDVIEFYRPLTLIVGQNGAGKTVRVETGFGRKIFDEERGGSVFASFGSLFGGSRGCMTLNPRSLYKMVI